jgi:two-component system, NarL family, response regulator LiaR
VTGDPPIRLMIVDDHPVVRTGIAAMLSACDDIDVVAETDSAREAVDLCGRLAVNVVLMDLVMPETDGVSATRHLVDHDPDVRVVVLTGFVDRDAARAAMQAGASACLLKSVQQDELVDAIRAVVKGRATFSSEFLPYLVDGAPAGRGIDLTARERDILALVADGRTNKGIAQALGLAEGTIRIYVSTILGKLGAANRTEATVVAIRHGLVP